MQMHGEPGEQIGTDGDIRGTCKHCRQPVWAVYSWTQRGAGAPDGWKPTQYREWDSGHKGGCPALRGVNKGAPFHVLDEQAA